MLHVRIWSLAKNWNREKCLFESNSAPRPPPAPTKLLPPLCSRTALPRELKEGPEHRPPHGAPPAPDWPALPPSLF